MEKYLKELAVVTMDLTKACGRMFEQEHLRFISMITAAGSSQGASGGGFKYTKGIMEHRVIQNLKAVTGDKSLFRQWHRRFASALGQCDQVHEEIIQHLVKETDLGEDLDKFV